MEISQLIPHVEALIFAADRPLPAADILELLNNAMAFLEDRATTEQVEAAIEAIQEKYDSEFYAFSVRESGGGYQFLTKKQYYQTVAQLNGEKFLKRLSTAALETLAIIAYRQPISKGEIEHIRGVSTDYSITKLLEKELIIIIGRSEELPGKPLLYSTSKTFMDYFGLNSPADLPKLKEIFEEDFVAPTQLTLDGAIEEELKVDEETIDDGHLAVTESGELTEATTVMMDDELPQEEGDGLEMSADEESVVEGEVASEEEVVDEDETLEDEAELEESDSFESEVTNEAEVDSAEDETSEGEGEDSDDADDADDNEDDSDDEEDDDENDDEEDGDNSDEDDDVDEEDDDDDNSDDNDGEKEDNDDEEEDEDDDSDDEEDDENEEDDSDADDEDDNQDESDRK